jgi:hypothetical protein
LDYADYPDGRCDRPPVYQLRRGNADNEPGIGRRETAPLQVRLLLSIDRRFSAGKRPVSEKCRSEIPKKTREAKLSKRNISQCTASVELSKRNGERENWARVKIAKTKCRRKAGAQKCENEMGVTGRQEKL